MPRIKRCGTVLIIGRANVGKSTILNRLLGRKISITSRRPQTTINRVLGVKDIEKESLKIFFMDTPGLYPGVQESIKSSKLVYSYLSEVDMILFISDVTRWGEKDAKILAQIKLYGLPVMLVLNKIDLLEDNRRITYLRNTLLSLGGPCEVIFTSSLKGDNLCHLEDKIVYHIPKRVCTPADKESSLQNSISSVSEILREKFMRVLQKELAHTIRIEIVFFKEKLEKIITFATIWVSKDSHKSILIGKRGGLLKTVCTRARRSMEATFQKKVYIKASIKKAKAEGFCKKIF